MESSTLLLTNLITKLSKWPQKNVFVTYAFATLSKQNNFITNKTNAYHIDDNWRIDSFSLTDYDPGTLNVQDLFLWQSIPLVIKYDSSNG